jgi:hypothetical protein
LIILSANSCASPVNDEDLKNAAKSNNKILYYEYSQDAYGYSVSRGALVLMDIENNKKIYISKDAPTSLNPTFSPDGEKIALTDFGRLEIWDLTNAKVKRIKITDTNISSLNFLNNETLLYSRLNQVFKYSLFEDKSELLFEANNGIIGISLSPSNIYLAVAIIKDNQQDLTPGIDIYFLSENRLLKNITDAMFIGWVNNKEILLRKYKVESENLNYQIVNILENKSFIIGEKINDSLSVNATKYLNGKNFMEFGLDKPHTTARGIYYYPDNIGLYEYDFSTRNIRLIFGVDETQEICDYYIKQ